MKKILLILVLVFVLPFVIATNWYVSITTSGNGSADSWANKKALSSFSWSLVQPGDTVYIDGGIENLTYSFTFQPLASGNSNSRITITRGIDPGHNGTPIFTSSTSIAGRLSTGYLNVNGIAFLDSGIDSSTFSIYFSASSHDIDLTNCSVHFTTNGGIGLEGNNIKILYCNLYTGLISSSREADGIWMAYGSNAEIAYNKIILENADLTTTNHKDIIQATQWQLSGGLSKIHHNFLYQIGTGALNTAGVYLSEIGGEWQIYNNVIVLGGTAGVSLTMTAQNYASGNPPIKYQAYVYNNVFHYMDVTQGVKFYGADKVSYKNNILYVPVHDSSSPIVLGLSGGTEYLTYPAIDFDYNQYRVPSGAMNRIMYLHESVSTPAGYSWSQWRALGQENHSEIFTSGNSISFAGIVPSSTLTDYELTNGSSGFDEGTSLTLFNDDILGTSRPQGNAWDVGAFEFIGNNYNPADTNHDGCISLGEISSYVGLWLQGTVTLGDVSSAVGIWLGGCQ